ncbi:hypothetical protein LTR56_009941 [Elasticomyces elasticus]|nr:hypothetical protein LTR56_009941 [Elasticomyces elasticus]KAK3656211.1 hypothetical protein LTR22_009919 [Elasticomyces elasticus]KAK4933729.1 hypothetical protein LTR49_000194 [Elasticomyces elasticus]KAK5756556.1 hypothetical protein LTS12_013392 [Elasticomyces elasticus]
MPDLPTTRTIKTTQIRPHATREDTKEAMQEHLIPNVQFATHVSYRSGGNHKHSSNRILPPGPGDTKAVLDSIPPAQVVLYVLNQIKNGNAAMAEALEGGLKEQSESSARIYHDEKIIPAVKTEAGSGIPGSSNGLSVRGSHLRKQSAAAGVGIPTKKKTHRGGKNKRRKWRQPTLEHSTLHSNRSPMSGNSRSGATAAPPKFPWEHMEAAFYGVILLYERFKLTDQQRLDLFEHVFLAEAQRLRPGVVINASKLRDVCKGKTDRTRQVWREVDDMDDPNVNEKIRRNKLRGKVVADIQAAAKELGIGSLGPSETMEGDTEAELAAGDHDSEQGTKGRTQKRQDEATTRAKAEVEAEKEIRTAFKKLVELHKAVPDMIFDLLEEFRNTQHESRAPRKPTSEQEGPWNLFDQATDDAEDDMEMFPKSFSNSLNLSNEFVADPMIDDVPVDFSRVPRSLPRPHAIKAYLKDITTTALLGFVFDRLVDAGQELAAGHVERARADVVGGYDIEPVSPQVHLDATTSEVEAAEDLVNWDP